LPGSILSGTRTLLFREEPSEFHPEIKNILASRLVFSFFALLVGLASCDAQTVLDLSRGEAALKLKNGDIGFILAAPLDRMGELARLHASAPYYAGLLAKDAEGGAERAAALFEAALDGKGRAQREAAGELLAFVHGSDEAETRRLLARLESLGGAATGPLRTLRAACLYKLDRFADMKTLYGEAPPTDAGPMDSAFLLLTASREAADTAGENGLAGKLADFFLAGDPAETGDAVPRALGLEEARRRVLEELGPRLAELAGPAAAAATQGRFALGRRAYGEALAHFRRAIAVDGDGELFFRYPSLLGDLGRALVYAAPQAEGMALFLSWSNRIREGGLDGKGLDLPEIRYYLFYYMGRMQRSLRRYAEAAEYFAQALDFAPNPAQADACIWYILNMSLQEQPQETAALIGRYSSRWNSDGYFADILDRLARHLVTNRCWNSMAEVFSLIEGRAAQGAAQDSIAKYAYILGSALSTGLATPESGSGPWRTAEEYFRITMTQGDASFYYPVAAASRLGEHTAPVSGTETPAAGAGKNRLGGNDREFLLGIFRYGAADFAFGFISRDADRLGPDELRTLASAFAEAGRWEESIRTVSYYAEREGYRMNKQDLELYYPRAFAELAEAAAERENLGRELFFGLLRTESAFSPAIRSWAGAVGLAQLMPATAADMALRVRRGGGPDYAAGEEIDLEDPEVNISLGAAYLRYLMDRTESPLMALLAYNGGIGRLRRWRNAEPDLSGDLFLETVEYNETREYGRKVLAAAAAYGYLYYGMTMEAVFADMYK
jgi:soluble lytic murein transglycosylase